MIGVLDSDLGGLGIVRSLMDRLPGQDVVFFGDTARGPYGDKSPGLVMEYALENAGILIRMGVEIIVLACDATACSASDAIAKQFNVLVLDGIDLAVQRAIGGRGERRIGVVGSRAAMDSGLYEERILSVKPDAKVYAAACPLLAPLISEGWLKRRETRMIVKKYLHPLKARRVNVLILASSRYSLLKTLFQEKIGKRVETVDGSLAAVDAAKIYLDQNPSANSSPGREGEVKLLVTDVTSALQKQAELILKKKAVLQIYRP